ncbi:GvpL/GvpF family gas vesicle protein [Streptomyces sp. URMC 123]|uniref:GvpL/GvpF family gas vesicle protein n=1 Tax=Streptomyces sp. URMC 123 TaxID=3423403 RepID=UPI003F1CDFF5
MTEPLHYVYAVTPAADCRLPAGLTGVGGAPVHTVPDEELAAVVSPVPAEEFEEAPLRRHLEDMHWLEVTARCHQQVVDAVAASACALPLRLATVCRGDEGVRRMLADGRRRFREAIELLDGRDEWGVKMYADLGPTVAVAGEESPRLATGREYLRRRREQRIGREETWRKAEDWARGTHQALARIAEHTRLHRPQDARLSGASGQNILNGAYLVPRREAGAFTALVGELAEQAHGVRIELTGPWAPYSFTGLASEPAGDDTAPAAEEPAGAGEEARG